MSNANGVPRPTETAALWNLEHEEVDMSNGTNGGSDGTLDTTLSAVAWKRCARCGETKKATEFRYHAKTTDHLQSYCTSCMREYDRDRHARLRSQHETKTAEPPRADALLAAFGAQFRAAILAEHEAQAAVKFTDMERQYAAMIDEQAATFEHDRKAWERERERLTVECNLVFTAARKLREALMKGGITFHNEDVYDEIVAVLQRVREMGNGSKA